MSLYANLIRKTKTRIEYERDSGSTEVQRAVAAPSYARGGRVQDRVLDAHRARHPHGSARSARLAERTPRAVADTDSGGSCNYVKFRQKVVILRFIFAKFTNISFRFSNISATFFPAEHLIEFFEII